MFSGQSYHNAIIVPSDALFENTGQFTVSVRNMNIQLLFSFVQIFIVFKKVGYDLAQRKETLVNFDALTEDFARCACYGLPLTSSQVDKLQLA